MIDSKKVKEVFAKHGVKVRVRNFVHCFRVVDLKGIPLDEKVCLAPMQELNLYNAFGRQDEFFVSQRHEAFLYKNNFSG